MSDRKRPGIHYAWAVCFGCFIIMIFTTPFVNALSNFYLKSVTEEFGISRSAFTFTSTLVGICGMVFSPLWGKIFSRSNIRTVFSLGLLLFALSYMSYALARNEYHLYLSALVVGFAFSGCAFMPVSILITVWFQKSRGLAMSLALSGIGVGGSVLSPVITQWIEVYGWRATYVYMGLMVIVIALPIVFFLLRHTPESKGILPYGAEPDEAKAPVPGKETLLGRLRAAAARKRPPRKNPAGDVTGHIPFAQLKRTGFFWAHMLGMFLIGIICSAPLRQINPYVADLHGAAFAATIVSIYAFIGIFGKLILGTINDRAGAIKSSMLAFGLMALSFFLLLLGSILGNAAKQNTPPESAIAFMTSSVLF